MKSDNTEKATVETDNKHEISHCKNCKLRLENKCPLMDKHEDWFGAVKEKQTD